MNDYDQAARYAVKHRREVTRGRLFPKLLKRLKAEGWLDSQSAPRPGEQDRRCDTILELSDTKGPWWAAIVELFTNSDANALERGGEYLWRFRGELRHGPHKQDKYNMALALLFLTNGPEERTIDMKLPGMTKIRTGLQPEVRVLSEQDALAHIRLIDENPALRWLLVWLPLMKGGETQEMARTWRRLAAEDLDLATMADLSLTFAKLTDCYDTYKAEMEGIMLMVSPYVEEARQEERLKLQRRNTVEILNERFSDGVPTSLIERINSEKDLAKLNRWHKHAITASLEEFERDM